jgi:hypothetical protein
MLYSTTFTGAENPLSESGQWIHLASTWYNLRKSGGLAFQARENDGFNDNYAHLAGFADHGDQTIIAEISIAASLDTVTSGDSYECELNLHMTDDNIGPNVFGYQCDCSLAGPAGGPYDALLLPVRWNGPQGDFHVYTASQSVTGVVTGDRMKVVLAAGSNILSCYWKRTIDPDYVLQYTQDVTAESAGARLFGQPGVAVFNRNAAMLGAAGWRFYQADDGLGSGAVMLGQGAL